MSAETFLSLLGRDGSVYAVSLRNAKMTKKPKPPCEHDWRVAGIVHGDEVLLLECEACKAQGTVEDPTHQEYLNARHEPKYVWKELDRVLEA